MADCEAVAERGTTKLHMETGELENSLWMGDFSLLYPAIWMHVIDRLEYLCGLECLNPRLSINTFSLSPSDWTEIPEKSWSSEWTNITIFVPMYFAGMTSILGKMNKPGTIAAHYHWINRRTGTKLRTRSTTQNFLFKNPTLLTLLNSVVASSNKTLNPDIVSDPIIVEFWCYNIQVEQVIIQQSKIAWLVFWNEGMA
jgi:hypothetical protein